MNIAYKPEVPTWDKYSRCEEMYSIRNPLRIEIQAKCVPGTLVYQIRPSYFTDFRSGPSIVNPFIPKIDDLGHIALYVDEADRSWCSSNAANDNRAVTIEVSSDDTAPYAVTDAAFSSLIYLVADICKRNGIQKLRWFHDKVANGDSEIMLASRFKSLCNTGCYNYALSWQRSVMDRGGLWMDSKSYLERWLRSWFGETLVVNG